MYKKIGLKDGQLGFVEFCNAISINHQNVITNRLSSTNSVRVVTKNDLVDIFDYNQATKADSLITNDRDISLFLYTADCAAIALCDIKNKTIAAIHSGWKNSISGVVNNTLRTLKEQFGTNPHDIIAYVGQGINKCCYDINAETAKQFLESAHPECVESRNSMYYLDLNTYNKLSLQDCGVPKERITVIPLCSACSTYQSKRLFHSYHTSKIDIDGNHLNGLNGMIIHLVK